MLIVLISVYLPSAGHVRISDLGLAIHLPPGKAAHGRVGTVGYMGRCVLFPFSFQAIFTNSLSLDYLLRCNVSCVPIWGIFAETSFYALALCLCLMLLVLFSFLHRVVCCCSSCSVCPQHLK